MKTINTPWGEINPSVHIFPVQYLSILYGVIYFLPFGIFNYFFKGEDSLIEWLQFLGYFFSFLFCTIILFSKKRDRSLKQTICWIILTLFCFYVAGEEISWTERITNLGSDAIRQINMQGETNLHNLKGFNDYLHFSFIFSGLFFGWFGCKFLPKIEIKHGIPRFIEWFKKYYKLL